MAMLNLSPDELLSTTRTVRKRLDLSRPVERALVEECVQLALQAPTGGNAQGWHFVLVTEPEPKRAIAALYSRSKAKHDPDPETISPENRQVMESSAYLAEHLQDVPVLVVPCIEGRIEHAPLLVQAVTWGSIIPATWSFMLAARGRGLGTAYTTLHLKYEREVAEQLGIPYDRYTQAALLPVAYYTGDTFRPADRVPLESIVHWEAW
jgi:nitroreductase